jgi:lambda repressor-like predicted transcriptional regulator
MSGERKNAPRKPIPVAEAALLYQQGASLARLAARYEVSGRTIRQALSTAGVRIRPVGGQRIPIPVEEAARLYATGQTLRQLADRYGVCETVIYDRLTETGTPLRRKTDPKQVDPQLLAQLARQAGLETAR